MRNILIWIKRHLYVVGGVLIALSAFGFSAIYKINQSRPPGEISVGKNGIYIAMQSAPIGVWVVMAIVSGAAGIIMVGYSLLKKRDDKEELDRQFNKLLKRK